MKKIIKTITIKVRIMYKSKYIRNFKLFFCSSYICFIGARTEQKLFNTCNIRNQEKKKK